VNLKDTRTDCMKCFYFEADIRMEHGEPTMVGAICLKERFLSEDYCPDYKEPKSKKSSKE